MAAGHWLSQVTRRGREYGAIFVSFVMKEHKPPPVDASQADESPELLDDAATNWTSADAVTPVTVTPPAPTCNVATLGGQHTVESREKKPRKKRAVNAKRKANDASPVTADSATPTATNPSTPTNSQYAVGGKEERKRSVNAKRKAKLRVHPNLIGKRRERVRKAAVPLNTNELTSENLPHQSTAWRGKFEGDDLEAELGGPLGTNDPIETVAELKARSYGYVPALGQVRPFIEKDGRIWAVLVPPPDNWMQGTHILAALLLMAWQCRDPRWSRRGDFDTHTVGVSHGTGKKRPAEYRETATGNNEHMREFLDSQHMADYFRYMEGVLLTWFERLWVYYWKVSTEVQTAFPWARFPSPLSAFSSFTFNVGTAICVSHRDVLNLAFGLCLVLVLGSFDHTKGGQLVLHEAKLIVEIPPGYTIIFPSATVTHGNVPLHNPLTETRQSIVGYSSAAIFQFYEHGFKLEGPAPTTNAAKEAQFEQGERDWQRGVEMLSTVSELGLVS